MDCNQAEYRIDKLEKRMDDKAELLDEHDRKLAAIETNMNNLVKSMDSLTRALWGVAGSTIAALVGFFVWYVQHI